MTLPALASGALRLQVTANRLEGSTRMREGASGSEGDVRRPATASAMMQRPFGTGRSLGAEPPPEARVLAKLEPGDVFGGGSLLLGDEEVPDRLGVLAASDVKLYAIAAADLQRRGSPELWRQIKEEVGIRSCHPLHRPGCTGACKTHVTLHAFSGMLQLAALRTTPVPATA